MKENTLNSQIGLGNKDLLEERPLQSHKQFLCIYFLYTCNINKYKFFFTSSEAMALLSLSGSG